MVTLPRTLLDATILKPVFWEIILIAEKISAPRRSSEILAVLRFFSGDESLVCAGGWRVSAAGDGIGERGVCARPDGSTGAGLAVPELSITVGEPVSCKGGAEMSLASMPTLSNSAIHSGNCMSFFGSRPSCLKTSIQLSWRRLPLV